MTPEEHRARRASSAAAVVEHVRVEIARVRFTYATEAMLQEGLSLVLDDPASRAVQGQPLVVTREHTLRGGRIDFLLETWHATVGLEVKVAGSTAAVERQLRRYAPDVDHLVLVTTNVAHGVLHGRVAGVPLDVIRIGRGL